MTTTARRPPQLVLLLATTTALLLLQASVAVAAAAAPPLCTPLRGDALPPGSPLKCVHVCRRERGWRMLPVLWAPLRVSINGSSSPYTVLTAGSVAELGGPDAAPVRWCGWEQVLRDPRVCQFTRSPLRNVAFGVDPGGGGGGGGGGLLFASGGGAAGFSCAVASSRELSAAAMALTALGALLFFNARRLTHSQAFRLSAGSLMFMSGTAVLVAFVLMRSVPYRRSLAAFLTVSTSSALALARWAYGTWLPDARTVLLSRPFAAYLLGSGLLGLGLTYWLDDTGNVKLNNSIAFALRAAGLAMVWAGVADEAASLPAIAALVAWPLLAALARRLLWPLLRGAAGGVGGVASAAVAAARTPKVPAATSGRKPPRPPSTSPRTGGDGAWGRRSAGRRRSSSRGDEPLLSDEEAEARRPTPRRSGGSGGGGGGGSGGWFSARGAAQRSAAAAAAAGGSTAAGAGRASSPLDKFPSFDAWVPSARAAPPERRPWHLRSPPPLSPEVLAAQPMLQQQRTAAVAAAAAAPIDSDDDGGGDEQRRRRHHALTPHDGDGGGDGDGDAYVFPSSASAPPPSPWAERLAVDVRRRGDSPAAGGSAGGRTPAAAASPAAAAAAAGGGGGDVSPLVAMGRIINADTGRTIAINGARFNELLARGYVADLRSGMLCAPTASSSPAQQQGAAAAAAGGGGGGAGLLAAAPSPASGARPRRGSRQAVTPG